ncbi:hypothetical protein [Streptomyces zagrosensis]|uniref:Uncharacterized protein n=1 Tax=Streptomyces zagrosensis TaxID=1042984 RepID=A0A7W9UYK1_9ACTN|nr:hypothetical protein [Streptomyces zagrosensis]MBB5935762.1 hypothetical protein [Streptomyces zagrosensis]
MIAVAIFLLPGLALLLFITTRLEDGLDDTAKPARHARRPQLRLIRGEKSEVPSGTSLPAEEPQGRRTA